MACCCCVVAGGVQVSAVRNEVLDVAAVVTGYQREVQSLKAQLAALTGKQCSPVGREADSMGASRK